jgi:predicted transcriptional regulator
LEKHRGWADIVSDILTSALNGTRRTRLMYSANLNSRRMEKYLGCLMELGLVEARNNSPVTYVTTDKGREWLRSYEKIKIGLFVEGEAS